MDIIIDLTTKDGITAYFAYVAKDATTETDIAEAVKNLSADQKKQAADFIAAFCRQRGIDPQAPEIQEVYQQTTEYIAAQEAKSFKDKQTQAVKDLITKATAYSEAMPNHDPGTDKDMIKAAADIAKAAQTLQGTKSASQKLPTFQAIVNDILDYDQDNDFTPTLFDGLPCPDGTFSIIAARPHGGKTSAMINIAREALKKNRQAFFINLEMNRRQIYTNLCLSFMYDLANDTARAELDTITETIKEFSHVLKNELRGKTYSVNDTFKTFQAKAMDAVNKAMAEKRLFIYDGIGQAMGTITADIAGNIKKGGVVLFDYIQNAPAGNMNEPRYLEIGKASRALVVSALTNQCVIIAGAQLGREVEKEKRPAIMSDLRESGNLETDGHNIIAIEPTNYTDGLATPAYTHSLKQREAKPAWEKAGIKAVLSYVYWTGTGKAYKTQKAEDSGARDQGKTAKRPRTDEETAARWQEIMKETM
jgi:hypothetical protein